MMSGNFASGLESLLDQKNITIEERRRILATNASLELIAIAVNKEGSENKLSEEFNNFAVYVDAIYEALSKQ